MIVKAHKLIISMYYNFIFTQLKLKGGDTEMAGAIRNGLVDENSFAAALNNNFSLPIM